MKRLIERFKGGLLDVASQTQQGALHTHAENETLYVCCFVNKKLFVLIKEKFMLIVLN